jgi:chromosome segregation protein
MVFVDVKKRELEEKLNSTQSLLDTKKREIEAKAQSSLKSQEELEKEVYVLQENVLSLKKRLGDKDQELKDKAGEIESLKSKRENLVRDLKNQNSELTVELMSQNSEKTRLIKQVKEMEEEISRLRSANFNSGIVQSQKVEVEKELRDVKEELKRSKQANLKSETTIQELKEKKDLEKDSEETTKKEAERLTRTLADLNREKVNLMRDMTILNDKYLKVQKESNWYKGIAKDGQNELEKCQFQLDYYIKIVQKLDGKQPLDPKPQNNDQEALGSKDLRQQKETKGSNLPPDDDLIDPNNIAKIKQKYGI